MDTLRTHLILDFLKTKKRCTLAELMQEFKVSSATIHRDVDALVRRDAVTRVRGGILWNDGASPRAVEASDAYLDRVVTHRKAKVAIARKAISRVEEGDILFLDSSTTVYEFACRLREAHFQHLTIVTNAVAIMQNFRKFPPHYVLIGLGGCYDAQLNSIVGAATLDQLSRVTVTKAFVSAFGMDERNVTTNHERQAELIDRVIAHAAHRYLLLDHSKFNRTGLYRLAPKGVFDEIISD